MVVFSIVIGVILAWGPGPAFARMEAHDLVPSATLLVPYFEVDPSLEKPSVTTELVVSNTTPTNIICITHFTLYTDQGIPTINFNALIPPGGTVEIDLYALFTEGELPFEAFGTDCEAMSSNAPVSAGALQRAHSGRSSAIFGGLCGAIPRTDTIARGFITIDTADECTDQTPRDADYFSDVATEENILTGHYTIRSASPTTAVSAPMVHIEADSTSIGAETFYYEFQSPKSTADGREPLEQRWTVPYYYNFTDLICWRDFLADEPFECEKFFVIPPVQVDVAHHDGNFVEVVSEPCAQASGRLPASSILQQFVSKTGSLTVDVDPDFGMSLSGGFTPRPQVYISAIHQLHPNGLSIHVPGVPAGDAFRSLFSEATR